MNRDEFNDLAFRMTEGTATPEDRARFEDALASQPEWRSAWIELRTELEMTRAALVDAAELNGPIVAVPPKRMASLLAAPPAPLWTFAPWRWVAGGLGAAVCFLVAFWLMTSMGTRQSEKAVNSGPLAFVVPVSGTLTITAPGRQEVTKLPAALAGDETVRLAEGGMALVLRSDGAVEKILGTYETGALKRSAGARWFTTPLAALAAPGGLTRGLESNRILSPRGATAMTEPVIAWTAESGKIYDVELQDVLNPAAEPIRAEGVRPPLKFSQWRSAPLVPGGIYILKVMEPGRPATVVISRFMVVTAPEIAAQAAPEPSALIAAAFAALNESPARTGDAWLYLQQLPQEWRETELGRRLSAVAEAP